MSFGPLHLHEEVLLLALRDEEGTMHAGAWVDDALGSAVLGELLLDGAVRAVVEDDTTYIEAVRAPMVEDELLARCYGWVANDAHRWTASDWVRDFALRPEVRPGTGESLVRRGILKCDEETVMWIFKRRLYPQLDPRPEALLLERLREAIFVSRDPVDSRTTVLVAVAHRTGLLDANFEARELKKHQARIDAIIAGNLTGDAARDVLDATSAAVQVAVFAAVIVPTVIG